MIAVALSGGVDSSAAAIILHEKGETLMGVTLYLGQGVPAQVQIDRARSLCTHLGIPHHVIDVSNEFSEIKNYFCHEYLMGRTPNPCALCNRDIKFGVLLDKARALGASHVATGHYVRKVTSRGRHFLTRAHEASSQEYFLGLVSQEALERSIFPLGDVSRGDAEALAQGIGLSISRQHTSQDACFIGDKGYVSFIESHTVFRPEEGDILNPQGHIVGRHKGVFRYTLGQRKGLGVGLGWRAYVLNKDVRNNTITVGEQSQWPHGGFSVKSLNFMKAESLEETLTARVKVRYRQEPQRAVVHPVGPAGADVEYSGIFAPGQLAVFYDQDDAVLCAGIIEYAPGDGEC